MAKKIRTAKLSVGAVAQRSDVKVSTLHFYEEKGLIHSIRNTANQRRYYSDVLRRIAVIKAAQRVGISLNDIKEALAFLPTDQAPTKTDWQKLSSQWNQQLNQKINALIALRDNMADCIGCGCLSLKKCPLYNPNDELGQNQTGAALLDRAAKEMTESSPKNHE